MKVLIIDDQKSIRESMKIFFSLRGWRVETAERGFEGLDLAKKFKPDLVILDIRLPDTNGLKVLENLRIPFPHVKVIMITAYQDMESTIQAIKLGAFDYLHKPIDINEMDVAIARLEKSVMTSSTSRPDNDFQPDFVSDNESPPHIIGKTKEMKEIFKSIAVLSESRATVLIQGESGTGKELVARSIHYYGSYRTQPFTVMDCSTLVPNLIETELFGYEKGAFTGAVKQHKGRLEITGQGTIFFDEIGELPRYLQSKLLRFLQEREFVRVGGNQPIKSDARVIAATNRDLRDMVRKGKFRKDLYFRLNVVTVELPPLRRRKADIPILAAYLLRKIHCVTNLPLKTLTEGALDRLTEYDWPGNVRELENTLTRAVAMSKCSVLTEEDITFSLENVSETERQLAEPSPLSLEEMEREHILRVLQACRWHLGKTCQSLGISRPTLRAKMKKFGLWKLG